MRCIAQGAPFPRKARLPHSTLTRTHSASRVLSCRASSPSAPSKLLKVVALSSAEAECAASCYACKEIEFIRNLCNDLGYTLHGRLALAVDNQAAIQIIENQGVTARNKHFEDSIHYVRRLYDLGRILPKYISTRLQRADGFTKPLSKELFRPWCSTLVR